MKERLDKKLVELALASTRSQAQQFISAGWVFEHGKAITKASYLTDGNGLEVRGDTHYVGRGAQKLLGALKRFPLQIKDKVAADIGASTGGFTQVLLEQQAKRVYAIDVGHDQLDARLVDDPRVINMQGTNIRHLESLPEPIEVMVSDLSFISLELALPPMQKLLAAHAEMLILVKPQFEVGRDGLDKHGIVKDARLRLQAVQKICQVCRQLSLGILGVAPSTISGKTGNQEYLLWLAQGQADRISTLDVEKVCL